MGASAQRGPRRVRDCKSGGTFGAGCALRAAGRPSRYRCGIAARHRREAAWCWGLRAVERRRVAWPLCRCAATSSATPCSPRRATWSRCCGAVVHRVVLYSSLRGRGRAAAVPFCLARRVAVRPKTSALVVVWRCRCVCGAAVQSKTRGLVAVWRCRRACLAAVQPARRAL